MTPKLKQQIIDALEQVIQQIKCPPAEVDFALAALRAEPVSEPVAYALVQKDGYTRHIGPKHDFVPEDCKEVALYLAAPTQSAPLTDNRVFELADSDECSPDDRGWGPKFSLLKFARAIEAAHAISAQPTQSAQIPADVAREALDAKRLDYLQETRQTCFISQHIEYLPRTDDSNRRDEVCVFDGWVVDMDAEPLPTIREAIDAAIAAQGAQHE